MRPEDLTIVLRDVKIWNPATNAIATLDLN